MRICYKPISSSRRSTRVKSQKHDENIDKGKLEEYEKEYQILKYLEDLLKKIKEKKQLDLEEYFYMLNNNFETNGKEIKSDDNKYFEIPALVNKKLYEEIDKSVRMVFRGLKFF